MNKQELAGVPAMSLSEKIEAAKARTKASLDAEIAKLTRLEPVLDILPTMQGYKRLHEVQYNNTIDVTYEAHSMGEVLAIMQAWREKYKRFLRIGQYRNGCCSVTAYPWDKYNEEHCVAASEDAMFFTNWTGEGFNTLKFGFYPDVPDMRLCVTIDMAFRCTVAAYTGHVYREEGGRGWGRTGNVVKRAPHRLLGCDFSVAFGGGGDLSGHWEGVMPYEKFISYEQDPSIQQQRNKGAL